MISERGLYNLADNLINYSAGPVIISISGESEKIYINLTDEKWSYMIPSLKQIVVGAWGVPLENIIQIDEITFEIDLNYKVLLCYIEYIVIFYPQPV